ncbi:hypothetical protein [Haloarcula amylovorans]|uniref:hypothetical protein n=1 Tax=Haloarcula amylovorans TaxID=2562280 RepID=UPI001430447D|nr:hypothetical protein [Halomicroarcula amylolytica]
MTFHYEDDEHGNGFLCLTESHTNVRVNINDENVRSLKRIVEQYEDANGEV